LVMLFTNQHSIRDVILFPQMRPEEGNEDKPPSVDELIKMVEDVLRQEGSKIIEDNSLYQIFRALLRKK
jgi:aspartyl-tRNA synthetase